MYKITKLGLGATFLSLCSFLSHAYEMGVQPSDFIDPNLAHVHFDFEKNHEKMTALSIYCLENENKLSDNLKDKHKVCSKRSVDNEDLDKFITSKINSEDVSSYVPLLEHVRWPDDPTRMLFNKRSMAKFGALIKGVPPASYGSCHNRAEEGTFSITVDGLLCNSHYGRLQFFHAMAEKNGEPALTTRAKIEEWLKFTYLVATGGQREDENYCVFWKDNKDFPNLSMIMYENSFIENGWCEDRGKWRKFVPFIHPFPAWNVGTTFNLICEGPIISKSCDFYSTNPDTTKLIALGAILHLIQDSYSNSHTNRGNSKPEAKVLCNPITAFNSYTDQDSKKHTISDKWPAFDSGCNQIGTIDPITASTLAIWYVHNNRPVGEFETFIAHVFGNPPSVESKAGTGQGYERN